MSFVEEFYRFCRACRKIWLIPVFVFLGLIASLFALPQGSVVAPYTMF
jgi:hypothetical protein